MGKWLEEQQKQMIKMGFGAMKAPPSADGKKKKKMKKKRRGSALPLSVKSSGAGEIDVWSTLIATSILFFACANAFFRL